MDVARGETNVEGGRFRNEKKRGPKRTSTEGRTTTLNISKEGESPLP